MKFFYILFFLLITVTGTAQYKGGSNDGSASFTLQQQNPLNNIYAGGSNDGTAMATTTAQNPLSNIYRGGAGDGFGTIQVNGLNALNELPILKNVFSSELLVEEIPHITPIYPNPSAGLFNIFINGVNDFTGYSYRVCSSNGVLVMQGNIVSANTRFDITRLAAGNYYVQVINRNKIENTYKIIVEH